MILSFSFSNAIPEVKPILKKKEDEINVINDTKTFIVLQCTVETSYPPAVFEWRECIHAFNNCSNIEGPNLFHKKGNSSKGESILIVTKQEFQKVSYQCSAKNNLGKDNLTWIVINKSKIRVFFPFSFYWCMHALLQ